MIFLPKREKPILTQLNNGDLFGDLWASFNLDLTNNLGRIRLTKMFVQSNSVSNADLGLPVGFRYFNSAWWTVAGAKVHTSATTQTGFTADLTASSPTTCSSDTADIELFNGNMYVTSQTGLNKFTGSAWSTNGTSLNTNTPHMMTVYGDRLYITDLYSKIYSINTSDTMVTSSSYTLSLTNSNANVITFLRSASNRIWVGTINTLGGKGHIYEWDGVSTQTTRSYRLESAGALSCVIKDDIPYVVDSNGRLMKWNGGSFIEIGRFPMSKLLLVNATNTAVNTRFIHPNGMTLIDGKINILINNLNGDVDASINENFPSGVWEYDENIGLYHKYSVSYSTTSSLTDYGQNRVFRVGALSEAKITNNVSGALGQLFAGVTYYSNATSTLYGVFIDDTNDTAQKYGYLVSNWISSEGLKDTWQKICAKYKKFLDSDDLIALKYRIAGATPTYVSITWTSTSTFTTTTSILGKEGYEVEVIQGTGSGKTAHITTIDWDNTNYTVTLDDTFSGVTTGTAKVRIQNWKKISEITGQNTESSKITLGDISSERIQLKVCMQFTGKDELHQVIIVNKPHELIA